MVSIVRAAFLPRGGGGQACTSCTTSHLAARRLPESRGECAPLLTFGPTMRALVLQLNRFAALLGGLRL